MAILSAALQPLLFNHAQDLALRIGVPFVSTLSQHTPNDGLFNPGHVPLYHHYQFLPYGKLGDTLLIATCASSDELMALARSLYGSDVSFVIASTRDITQWIAARAATRHSRNAMHSLRRRFRHLCADRTLLPKQILPLLWPLIALAAGLIFAPASAAVIIIGMCNIFYAATLVFKLILYKEWQAIHRAPPTPEPALNEAALPIYTIFVPVYKEPPHVISQLSASIAALDYPDHLKDVLFICESDDEATIAALKAAKPPSYCRIIYVPKSLPRTKPKALNVALAFAKGTYGVIYDAEDMPEPQQLKKAVARFQADPELSCLQASLNYYNRNETLLTELFAIEYGTLFRMQLPALQRLGLPIPLGGTSNHIRMDDLREACGWDAFNVTEDADLGVRLSFFGKKVEVLNAITMEEAPITLRAWLAQRSRWIKGYIQTWLVYMREPAALKNALGTRAYYGFQFFIGAPALTFLMAPFFWGVFFATQLGLLSLHIPLWLNLSCLICLIWGIYSQWLYAKACLIIHGWAGMRKAATIFPFYWVLHTVASFIALYDIIWRPHYWQKTKHGVSRAVQQKNPQAA